MMIPKKIRKQNKLPLILFLIVFLNYIPLFIANYNTKTSNGVGVKPMVLCFGIECIVLTIFLFKKIKNFIQTYAGFLTWKSLLPILHRHSGSQE